GQRLVPEVVGVPALGVGPDESFGDFGQCFLEADIGSHETLLGLPTTGGPMHADFKEKGGDPGEGPAGEPNPTPHCPATPRRPPDDSRTSRERNTDALRNSPCTSIDDRPSGPHQDFTPLSQPRQIPRVFPRCRSRAPYRICGGPSSGDFGVLPSSAGKEK